MDVLEWTCLVRAGNSGSGLHTPADGGIEACDAGALTPHCVKNRADWPAVAARGDNTRMQIQLNGEPRAIAAQTTVLQLVQAEGLGERRVAVEVNGEIVPRGRHGEHALSDGDRVEIVHALGGG